MQARLISFEGQSAVAGLTWGAGGDFGSASRLRFGKRGQGFVTWARRRAETDQADCLGQVPLAYLIGQLITGAEGVSIALLELSDGSYWAGEFKGGIIVLEGEHIFVDAQSGLEWAAARKASQLADALFVQSSFVGQARATDAGLEPQELAPLPKVDSLPEAPRVVGFRVVSRKAQLIGGAAIVGLVITVLGVGQLFEYLSAPKASELERPPEVKLQGWAVDNAAFAQACRAALDQDWPGVPGWELTAFGCALPGVPRPVGAVADGIAWREYGRGAAFAAIPGSGVTSARMAALMYSDWPHVVQIVEGRILAGIPVSVSWGKIEDAGEGDAPALLPRLENAFVGIMSRDLTLKAPPTAPASSQPKAAAEPEKKAEAVIEVQVQVGLEEALARALKIPEIDVLSVNERAGLSNLVVAPRKARLQRPEGSDANETSAATVNDNQAPRSTP